MALRQTMNLSQNLVITPQLQQAIKLLQMSRLELETQVRSELEENPCTDQDLDCGHLFRRWQFPRCHRQHLKASVRIKRRR